VDADADMDADTHTDPNHDSNPYCHPDGNTHTNSDKHIDAYANGCRKQNPYPDRRTAQRTPVAGTTDWA
jgi:hypothetical protein